MWLKGILIVFAIIISVGAMIITANRSRSIIYCPVCNCEVAPGDEECVECGELL